jgi:hypothetical protein
MATIRREDSFTASETKDNLISGSKFEFPETNVVVRIFAVCDNTEFTAGARLEMDATAGNVIAADAVSVSVFTDDLGPNRNEHLITRFVARAGQRIQIKARETAGFVQNLRTLIDIDEIV